MDLIQKACNLGFILKNKEYYLWELQRWLREEHGIHIVVIPTVTSDWTFKTVRVISKIDHDVIKGIKSISELPPYNNVHGYDYTTYEEALEQGLLEALKLIN